MLTLLVVLAVPIVAAAAEGGIAPPPAPEGRIGNPGGLTADDEPSLYEQFVKWLSELQARIGNPGG